jgi:hypothetical protein
MRPKTPEDPRRALAAAFHATDLPIHELWLRYFGLGGMEGQVDIEAYLEGLVSIPALEHDVLAQAINERLDELPDPPRAPFLAGSSPGSDLDTAIDQLSRSSRRASRTPNDGDGWDEDADTAHGDDEEARHPHQGDGMNRQRDDNN